MLELTQAYMMQVGPEDCLDVGQDSGMAHDIGNRRVADCPVERHPIVGPAAWIGVSEVFADESLERRLAAV